MYFSCISAEVAEDGVLLLDLVQTVMSLLATPQSFQAPKCGASVYHVAAM